MLNDDPVSESDCILISLFNHER